MEEYTMIDALLSYERTGDKFLDGIVDVRGDVSGKISNKVGEYMNVEMLDKRIGSDEKWTPYRLVEKFLSIIGDAYCKSATGDCALPIYPTFTYLFRDNNNNRGLEIKSDWKHNIHHWIADMRLLLIHLRYLNAKCASKDRSEKYVFAESVFAYGDMILKYLEMYCAFEFDRIWEDLRDLEKFALQRY